MAKRSNHDVMNVEQLVKKLQQLPDQSAMVFIEKGRFGFPATLAFEKEEEFGHNPGKRHWLIHVRNRE